MTNFSVLLQEALVEYRSFLTTRLRRLAGTIEAASWLQRQRRRRRVGGGGEGPGLGQVGSSISPGSVDAAAAPPPGADGKRGEVLRSPKGLRTTQKRAAACRQEGRSKRNECQGSKLEKHKRMPRGAEGEAPQRRLEGIESNGQGKPAEPTSSALSAGQTEDESAGTETTSNDDDDESLKGMTTSEFGDEAATDSEAVSESGSSGSDEAELAVAGSEEESSQQTATEPCVGTAPATLQRNDHPHFDGAAAKRLGGLDRMEKHVECKRSGEEEACGPNDDDDDDGERTKGAPMGVVSSRGSAGGTARCGRESKDAVEGQAEGGSGRTSSSGECETQEMSERREVYGLQVIPNSGGRLGALPNDCVPGQTGEAETAEESTLAVSDGAEEGCSQRPSAEGGAARDDSFPGGAMTEGLRGGQRGQRAGGPEEEEADSEQGGAFEEEVEGEEGARGTSLVVGRKAVCTKEAEGQQDAALQRDTATGEKCGCASDSSSRRPGVEALWGEKAEGEDMKGYRGGGSGCPAGGGKGRLAGSGSGYPAGGGKGRPGGSGSGGPAGCGKYRRAGGGNGVGDVASSVAPKRARWGDDGGRSFRVAESFREPPVLESGEVSSTGRVQPTPKGGRATPSGSSASKRRFADEDGDVAAPRHRQSSAAKGGAAKPQTHPLSAAATQRPSKGGGGDDAQPPRSQPFVVRPSTSGQEGEVEVVAPPRLFTRNSTPVKPFSDKGLVAALLRHSIPEQLDLQGLGDAMRHVVRWRARRRKISTVVRPNRLVMQWNNAPVGKFFFRRRHGCLSEPCRPEGNDDVPVVEHSSCLPPSTSPCPLLPSRPTLRSCLEGRLQQQHQPTSRSSNHLLLTDPTAAACPAETDAQHNVHHVIDKGPFVGRRRRQRLCGWLQRLSFWQRRNNVWSGASGIFFSATHSAMPSSRRGSGDDEWPLPLFGGRSKIGWDCSASYSSLSSSVDQSPPPVCCACRPSLVPSLLCLPSHCCRFFFLRSAIGNTISRRYVESLHLESHLLKGRSAEKCADFRFPQTAVPEDPWPDRRLLSLVAQFL